MSVPRLRLAHLPTPIEEVPRLFAVIGAHVWVKRDDMTSGADAGNKLRKLEYLIAEAEARDAQVVITCGAVQSNHARATAVVAARRGLRTKLFLRLRSGEKPPATATGNYFVDRFVGADITFITAEEYRDRNGLMADAARDLERRGERAQTGGRARCAADARARSPRQKHDREYSGARLADQSQRRVSDRLRAGARRTYPVHGEVA